MAALQLVLIASGNLSFLNWLTLVPIAACFDDGLWRRVLPRFVVARAERARAGAAPSRAQGATVAALGVAVALLSIGPVVNMLSNKQLMNTSFTRLPLVNTYGAFGSVGRERDCSWCSRERPTRRSRRRRHGSRTNGNASPPIPHAGPAG